MIPEINDATFEAEVLKSPIPVLVDFYRPTCSVCPVLEELLVSVQPAYEGKLKMVKLNTDKGSESAQRSLVTAHPTSVIFIDGKIAGTLLGAAVKPYLLEFLDKALPKK